MTDAIEEIKVRAAILHRRIQAGDGAALKRLRMLPDYRRLSVDSLKAAAPDVQRRHCLSVIAAELGFSSWPRAKQAISGSHDTGDFGTLLCPTRCAVYLNGWYRTYEEAAADRAARGGYLLAYRMQFLVTDRGYIETLGLDPDDPDWQAMGHDWARPRDAAARARLYGKLIAALPREGA